MIKSALLLALSIVAIACGEPSQEDSLKQLQKLIKQLADDDPKLRESAQKNILDLLKKEIEDYDKDIAPLIKEMKKEIDGGEIETRERLKTIFAELIKDKYIDENGNPIKVRYGHCEIVTEKKIIIWGGIGKQKYLSTGAVYDIDKKCWSKISDCPIEGRTNFVAGVSGNNLIIWGGRGKDYAFYNDGVIYNTDKATWEKIKPSPLDKRTDCYGLILEDKLIVWGGRTGNKWNNNGAVFNIKKGVWQEIKDFPFDGYYSRALISEKNLAVWGGADKDKYYSQGALYNIEKNSWDKIADCPIDERSSFFFASSGAKLIVWSGSSKGRDSFMDGAIYDTKESKWEKIPECPLEKRSCTSIGGRFLPIVAMAEKKLILWGGSYLGNFYDDGAIYNIEKTEWEKMEKSPLDARDGHLSVILGNKLIIWGGHGKGVFYKDGAIYDLEKKSWEIMTISPLEERENPIVKIHGKKLIIWGGHTSGRLNNGAIYDTEKGSWEKIEDCPLR